MGNLAQKLNRSSKFGQIVIAAAAVCLVWIGVTGLGMADMRIVTESEGIRTETLFQGNRIASPNPDGSNMLLFCQTGEITMISPSDVRRYWQGTVSDFKDSLATMIDDAFGAAQGDGGMPDLGALLGTLFGGGSDAEETLVRVSKAGEATVAGYAAEHYVVETGSRDNWQVYEELWISSDLMNEVTAEVGACVDLMLELQGELEAIAPFVMDDLEAVLASPDYQALMAQGFPVRSKQTMRIFGMPVETSSEVVEVSRQSIPADAFAIPAGYQRVDSPLELFGL